MSDLKQQLGKVVDETISIIKGVVKNHQQAPKGFISCDDTAQGRYVSGYKYFVMAPVEDLRYSRPSAVATQPSGSASYPCPSTEPKEEFKIAQNNTSKMGDLFSSVPGMNLSFGKLTPGLIALSMNGELAFRDKSGNYVTIQKEGAEKTRVDVGSLKFDIDFYKVPTQDLEVDDIVLLDNELLQVDSKKNGDIAFVNPITGARTNKLKRSNIFGMYFYTKIVSLFNMAGAESTGLGLNGLDPMTLMLLSGQGGLGGGSGDLSQLLILSQLTKGGNEMNPMMLMALTQNGSNGGGMNDMMQFIMMSQAMGGGKAFGSGLFGAKKKAAAKPAAIAPAVTALPAPKKRGRPSKKIAG